MKLVDLREILGHYTAQKYDDLSRTMLRVLDSLHGTDQTSLTPAARGELHRLMNVMLTVFCQPDYVISRNHAADFIRHNATFAHLCSLTPYRTTDPFLETLQLQENNFTKLLTLYSVCNQTRYDARIFFDKDATLASLWFFQVCELYRTIGVMPEARQRLWEHLQFRDDRLMLSAGADAAFFGATYLDGERDREPKQYLNQLARKALINPSVRNRPDPRKVAVISDLMCKGHSVWRTLSGYVRTLRPDFHVTGFHILRTRQQIDTSLYDEVVQLPLKNGVLDISRLRENDFVAVYFPDIGMTIPSIMLSNLRLAPIQLCGTGHPVSTWGSEIDWFVSGQDVEYPENVHTRYSERVLLLPGFGAIHEHPNLPIPKATVRTDRVVVNCPSLTQKLNPTVCRAWKRIFERLGDRILLRLYGGGTLARHAGFFPFIVFLRQLVGNDAPLTIVPNVPYDRYLGFLAEGQFALDSFHFGGSNVVADSLYLRKPIVCWEGDRWYNRIGPAMLRSAGLDELVARSEDEYVDKVVRLVEDADYRAQMTNRVRQADLAGTVFSDRHAGSFREALKLLVQNWQKGTLVQLPNPLAV